MIDGIFFSEFDNNVGPIVRFQDPAESISAEVFDTISEYIITKPSLCERVLVVVTPDKRRILSFPINIEDKRYLRNSILFNICFIFNDIDTNIEIYHPIVQKLVQTFKILEVENEFLYNADKKEYLLTLLPNIRSSLNDTGICYMPVEFPLGTVECNPICLRIFPAAPPCFQVDPSHNPTPIHNVNIPEFWNSGDKLAQEDLGLRALVIAIKDTKRTIFTRGNGVSPLHRGEQLQLQNICERSKMDPNLAKSGVQILAVCGLVKVIPSFDYHAFYAVTDCIRSLFTIQSDREMCINYIAVKQHEYSHLELVSFENKDFTFPANGNFPLPTFSSIFSTYCAMDGSTSFYTFLSSHPLANQNIHERYAKEDLSCILYPPCKSEQQLFTMEREISKSQTDLKLGIRTLNT